MHPLPECKFLYSMSNTGNAKGIGFVRGNRYVTYMERRWKAFSANSISFLIYSFNSVYWYLTIEIYTLAIWVYKSFNNICSLSPTKTLWNVATFHWYFESYKPWHCQGKLYDAPNQYINKEKWFYSCFIFILCHIINTYQTQD